MNFYASHYRTGEEIRLDDHILWAGTPGSVLFVLGQPGVPLGWVPPEDVIGATEGFMLELDGIGLVFERESDEDLDLVERKQ